MSDAIRLETAKRTGIQNEQTSDLMGVSLDLMQKQLERDYPKAVPRTRWSIRYNCHGLAFASRRTKVYRPADVLRILGDDVYHEIKASEVKAGDVVIYYSDLQDPTHSGYVIATEGDVFRTTVLSKWGNCGEFIHPLYECPPVYGRNAKFYRCEP